MKIDNTILTQVEKLAKINLENDKKPIAMQKMQNILDGLDKIDLAEIEGLEPLSHPLEVSQILREDIANSKIDRDYLQKNAPKTEDGLFLVPKVI